MQGIIDEQIELSLGEDYPQALDRARKFVYATIQQGYYGGKRNIVMNNEGGFHGMVRNCLATILETGSIKDGLERWSNRLADEYVNGPHTRWEGIHSPFDDTRGAPISKEIDVRLREGNSTLGYKYATVSGLESGESLSSFEDDAPGESAYTHSRIRRDSEAAEFLQSSEEWELYETLAFTNNLEEAAELIGISYEDAKRINKRVYKRVSRKGIRRGRRMSSLNAPKHNQDRASVI